MKYPLGEAYVRIKKYREEVRKRVNEYLGKLRETLESKNVAIPSSHTYLAPFPLANQKLNQKDGFRLRKTSGWFIEKHITFEDRYL